MKEPSESLLGECFKEYYVYDFAYGGRMVFCSASDYKKKKAARLAYDLSESERREWETYLKSYQMTPAVAETSMGVALVLPYMMPSSTLAMVCIPKIKSDSFRKLAMRDPRKPILLGEQMRNAQKGRLHDADGELKHAYEMLMGRIEAAYASAEYGAHTVPCEMGGALAERLCRISELLGYPVCIARQDSVTDYGELDEGVFMSCVSALLTLGKTDVPLGVAEFTIEQKSYGCSVSMLLRGWRRVRRTPHDLIWMDRLAGRKRLFLDFTVTEEGLWLCFSPMNKDLSYLGLKQNRPLDWLERLCEEPENIDQEIF